MAHSLRCIAWAQTLHALRTFVLQIIHVPTRRRLHSTYVPARIVGAIPGIAGELNIKARAAKLREIDEHHKTVWKPIVSLPSHCEAHLVPVNYGRMDRY
jgi:GTP cyclohydrolase I